MWPNQWTIFRIQINKPPQNNQNFPADPPQRKLRVLAARIVSKPAAIQHPYCTVYCTGYCTRKGRLWLTQTRDRERGTGNPGRGTRDEGWGKGASLRKPQAPETSDSLIKLFSESLQNHLLQGYPFWWACLQNNKASKPPRIMHISEAPPKEHTGAATRNMETCSS